MILQPSEKYPLPPSLELLGKGVRPSYESWKDDHQRVGVREGFDSQVFFFLSWKTNPEGIVTLPSVSSWFNHFSV